MPLPPVTVTIPIPGTTWRRWLEVQPRTGISIQSLVPVLLELYLDREERLEDGLSGIEYQI